MGTFSSELVSNEAYEIDFLTAVYNRIMGTQGNPSIFWSGITCTVTPEGGDPIENGTPSDMVYEDNKYCNMDFLLDSTNNVVLRLQIKPVFYWYQRCSCYNFTLRVNDQLIFDKKEGSSTRKYDGDGVRYADGGGDGQVTTFAAHRELTFSKYISDNVEIYWISPKLSSGTSSFKDARVSFMKFKDSNGYWHWAGYEGPSPMDPNGVVRDIDGTHPGKSSTIFTYEAKTGYLDFISHVSFMSAGVKTFSSPYIYNCTSVNFGDTLSIQNGANFLAIGSNFMVNLD